MLPELNEIKLRRLKLGLTQQELARLARVSQATIAKIENGKVVPRYDVAKRIFDALEALEHREEKRAKEIMNSPVIFVSPEESLEKAAEKLRKYGISQLPVIENNQVIGRINEKILLEAGRENYSKPVKEFMQEPFLCVHEETPLSIVREILKRDSLVVVKSREGVPIGVITRSDLL